MFTHQIWQFFPLLIKLMFFCCFCCFFLFYFFSWNWPKNQISLKIFAKKNTKNKKNSFHYFTINFVWLFFFWHLIFWEFPMTYFIFFLPAPVVKRKMWKIHYFYHMKPPLHNVGPGTRLIQSISLKNLYHKWVNIKLQHKISDTDENRVNMYIPQNLPKNRYFLLASRRDLENIPEHGFANN